MAQKGPLGSIPTGATNFLATEDVKSRVFRSRAPVVPGSSIAGINGEDRGEILARASAFTSGIPQENRSACTIVAVAEARRTMMPRLIALVSMLVFGLLHPTTPAALAQDIREAWRATSETARPESPTEAPRRTIERSVVEGPSTTWDTSVVSEVVNETLRRDAGTTVRTRNEFVTDANGRHRLVSTMEEQRIARPDGGHQIMRDFAEPDVNGRSRTTRREREEMVVGAHGIFVTEIEVTEPFVNGGGFVPTARIEQRERRVGDQLVERESTTYSDPTARGRWDVLEQRVLTRALVNGSAEAVEVISRPDASGKLVQSERIVSKERTAGGREVHTDEIYRRDINNGGALTQHPVQQVEIVRTIRPDGGSETTRTVSERTGDQWQVIEQVVERSRPDGRGGMLIEQEILRSVVYGRLETVLTGSTQRSQ